MLSDLASVRFTTHGETRGRKRTKEYSAWKDAKARCHNSSHASFKDYGAKGVVMCKRWHDDFSAFLADVGRAPTRHHSLDRIDPTGSYEPGNVRWADSRTQSLNTRKGVVQHELDGVFFTVKELARAYGVDSKAITRRLRLGEELKEAIRHIQALRPNRRYPARP